MQPFKTHTGIAAPLNRVNVDTDAIIPKQFLRKIEKTGFGKHLFHEWRYSDYEGTKENPDFILNQEPYRKATCFWPGIISAAVPAASMRHGLWGILVLN